MYLDPILKRPIPVEALLKDLAHIDRQLARAQNEQVEIAFLQVRETWLAKIARALGAQPPQGGWHEIPD